MSVQSFELFVTKYLDVLGCTPFRTFITIFDNLETLGHHHLGKPQSLASESAVTIGSGVLCMKDSN